MLTGWNKGTREEIVWCCFFLFVALQKGVMLKVRPLVHSTYGKRFFFFKKFRPLISWLIHWWIHNWMDYWEMVKMGRDLVEKASLGTCLWKVYLVLGSSSEYLLPSLRWAELLHCPHDALLILIKPVAHRLQPNEPYLVWILCLAHFVLVMKF